MGMGKTVEVLALILANPAPASIVSGAETAFADGRKQTLTRGTLVVCKVRCRCLGTRAPTCAAPTALVALATTTRHVLRLQGAC